MGFIVFRDSDDKVLVLSSVVPYIHGEQAAEDHHVQKSLSPHAHTTYRREGR